MAIDQTPGDVQADWEDLARLVYQRKQELTLDALKQAKALGVRLVVRGRAVTAVPETADGLLKLFLLRVNREDDIFQSMLKLGGVLH